MIVGILGYLNTNEIISECDLQASNAGLFTSEYRQVCNNLPLLNYLMPIMTVIGLGLMGYGIVAKKKIKIKEPIQESNSLTDDYIKMAKRFEELTEKHDRLEKRYAQLTIYLKKNGIEIPDHVVAQYHFGKITSDDTEKP